MIYLIEMGAYDPSAGGETTLRFAGGVDHYTTRPSDDPPNAEYDGRVSDPGNFERHLFGRNRTWGQSDGGTGVIKLENPDGVLDGLLEMTFDGRPVRIWSVEPGAAFASRTLLLSGLIDDVSFAYLDVSVTIRDRLDALRKTLQQATYAGTTTHGGMAEAEGAEDLKDKPKPELYGRALNIPAIEVDRFDRVYQVAANGLSAVTAVRDRGVELTAGANFSTLAALKAATISAGGYATCLTLGLIRTGSPVDGQLTVDAVEGATLADRSAARVARRMLDRLGLAAGIDYVAADFDALHALNPAEVGYWSGIGEADALGAISSVLDSIGGYLVPDRTGAFRTGRLELPSNPTGDALDETIILDEGSGVDRTGTNDEGSGKPARKITLRWGYNNYVMRRDELYRPTSGGEAPVSDTEAAYRAFVTEEWRQVTVESAAVAAISPDAPELTFDTLLVAEADAVAEANRKLAIYSARRDLFSVPVMTAEIGATDITSVKTMQMPRFGLDEGRPFRVIGETANYEDGQTTLVLWG